MGLLCFRLLQGNSPFGSTVSTHARWKISPLDTIKSPKLITSTLYSCITLSSIPSNLPQILVTLRCRITLFTKLVSIYAPWSKNNICPWRFVKTLSIAFPKRFCLITMPLPPYCLSTDLCDLIPKSLQNLYCFITPYSLKLVQLMSALQLQEIFLAHSIATSKNDMKIKLQKQFPILYYFLDIFFYI